MPESVPTSALKLRRIDIKIVGGKRNTQDKVHHKSTIENYISFTRKKIKSIRHFQSQSDNDKFDLQSFGLDLDANYVTGKFYIEPEIYFDYYLPSTSDKRFSQIYSLNIGITF